MDTSSRARVALLIAVLVGATIVAPVPAIAGRCPEYSDPKESGTIRDSRINEVSGVVASRAHRRLLWIQEDSGNGPWVYSITPRGDVRAAIEVENATNLDWEDLAFARGRLWIGDVGDNRRVRSEIRIYWFREPGLSRESVRARVVTLRYPDGAHNSEAIVVDGRHRRVFVFEKLLDVSTSRVYSASLRGVRSGDTLDLRLVARVPLPNVTAADVGKHGVVIKNYGSAIVLPWRSTRVVRTLRRGTPCPVALPASESVAFSLTGHRLYSIPEGGDPEISFARRR